MDKALAQKIAKATEAALAEVAKEFGLDVKVGGGKYDPGAGTFAPKVEFFANDSAERDFKRIIGTVPVDYATGIGSFVFTEDDWNVTFKSHGKTFSLCGVNPRSPKYALSAKCLDDGKTYKFTASSVARALGR